MKIKVNTIVDKNLQDESIVDKIVDEIKEIENRYTYINHEFASLVMIDVDQIVLKYQQQGYQIEKEFIIDDDNITINLEINLKKKEEEEEKKEETE